MKKLLLTSISFLALGALSYTAQAQCTPDPNLTDVGITPDTLVDGNVGQAYSQVIQVVMPKDTSVTSPFTFTAYFCNFGVKAIPNMPGGMNFALAGAGLDPNDNTNWIINHTPGVTNRGCILLSGIPQDTLVDDSLTIQVKFGLSTDNPATTGSCNPSALLPNSTSYRFKWRINPASSIDNNLQAALGLKLAPNPTTENTTLSLNLNKSMDIKVSVVDVVGKEVKAVFDGNMTSGSQNLSISTQNFANGMYFVRISANGNSTTLKLVVNK